MQFQEINTKTVDEINTIISDSKKELFNLRFQKVTSAGLEKTHRPKELRRIVAKAKTALKQKQTNDN